jgi:hypothetical protein
MSSVLLSQVLRKHCGAAAVLAVAAAAGLFGLSAASASPVTVSFRNGTNSYTGAQDATIVNYYSEVNTNFGANTSAQVGDAGTDLRDFIIRFDGLNVLAGQYSSIISAQLDLRQTGNGHGPANVSVYKMNDANAGWIEGAGTGTQDPNGGVTWSDLAYYASPNANTPVPWNSNAGGFVPGTDSDSVAMDSVAVDSTSGSGTHYQWDISPSLVNQWITGGANAGLLLSVDNPASDVWAFYTSNLSASESTTAQPMLTITYAVPEPMTGALLLIGGGLVALRRRRM